MKPNAKINRTITINSTVQTTTTSSSNFHVMLFFYYSQNPKRIEFLLLITTTINVIGLFLFSLFRFGVLFATVRNIISNLVYLSNS